MAEQNVQVVRKIYAALESGNSFAMLGLLSPSIKVWQAEELPWGGTHEGLLQVNSFFSKIKSYVDAKVTVERIVDSGEFVVVMATARGTIKATGKPFEGPLAHVWEMRDGKAAGLRVFQENDAILAALA